MKRKGRTDPLWLAGAAILLAGLLHFLEHIPLRHLMYAETVAPRDYAVMPYLSTILFLLTNGIYVVLLIAWIHSVYHRLLPSRPRRYILACAGFMLLLLTERMAEYRIFEGAPTVQRLCWYAYYLPLSFIPTLFLMLSIEIRGSRKKPDPRFLLLPAAIFAALFLTNDLHHWIFISADVFPFTSAYGTYRYGLLYYIFLVCCIGAVLTGLAFLTAATAAQKSVKKRWRQSASWQVCFSWS